MRLVVDGCAVIVARIQAPPPRSLQDLLERQWEQTAHFILDQAGKQNNGNTVTDLLGVFTKCVVLPMDVCSLWDVLYCYSMSFIFVCCLFLSVYLVLLFVPCCFMFVCSCQSSCLSHVVSCLFVVCHSSCLSHVVSCLFVVCQSILFSCLSHVVSCLFVVCQSILFSCLSHVVSCLFDPCQSILFSCLSHVVSCLFVVCQSILFCCLSHVVSCLFDPCQSILFSCLSHVGWFVHVLFTLFVISCPVLVCLCVPLTWSL